VSPDAKDRNICNATPTNASSEITPTLSSHAVESQRVKAWFWQTISPQTSSGHTWNSTSRWLYHVLQTANPQPALREALLAISTTAFGKLNGEPALLIEGHRLYSKALHLLRLALDESVSAQHDDTLDATCLMILFEVFLNDSCQVPALTYAQRFNGNVPTLDGWVSHMNGLTLLLQQRGPKRHCTSSSRAALEYCRYMIVCLTFLGSPLYLLMVSSSDDAGSIAKKICSLGPARLAFRALERCPQVCPAAGLRSRLDPGGDFRESGQAHPA
jgi:hypothetical protein